MEMAHLAMATLRHSFGALSPCSHNLTVKNMMEDRLGGWSWGRQQTGDRLGQQQSRKALRLRLIGKRFFVPASFAPGTVQRSHDLRYTGVKIEYDRIICMLEMPNIRLNQSTTSIVQFAPEGIPSSPK